MELDCLLHNSAKDLFQFSYPLALHLDAWVLPANTLMINDPKRPSVCTIAGHDAILSLSQGPADPSIISKMLREGKWDLLMLGGSWKACFLVIENHTDFAYRVGTVVVYVHRKNCPLMNSLMQRRRVCLK